MNEKIKRMVALAMLCAVSYVVVFYIRIPVVLFLKYEPKDVVITIGGLIFGPLSAMLISVVVSLIEFVTISDTGLWGLLMNMLSTCAFACPAAWFYGRQRSRKGAVLGLLLGTVLMVAVMLVWNYLITPIYMGLPREEVAALLAPIFLPFNLFKGGMNAAITLFLYKPVVTGLRKASLVPATEGQKEDARRLGMLPAALLILVTSVLVLLVMKGII